MVWEIAYSTAGDQFRRVIDNNAIDVIADKERCFASVGQSRCENSSTPLLLDLTPALKQIGGFNASMMADALGSGRRPLSR
jgi:hypothetical protein